MAFKKIVQVGAGGTLGAPILNALVASGKFDVRVVTRIASSYTAPNPAVNVVEVDYADHNALVEAFKGYEALVLTLGDIPTQFKNSKPLIDAAIDAGVTRVIPSEFGNDLSDLPGKKEAFYTSKVEVVDYLKEKVTEGKIEYTAIATGGFFEFGIKNGFQGFDIPNQKATIYTSEPYNTTTMSTIAESVVAVLSNPDVTKDKYLRIHDFFVSQNDILKIIEEETGKKFTVEQVDIDEVGKKAAEGLSKGEVTLENIFAVVGASIFGKKSSTRWGDDDDTNSLGLPKKDLREVIKKLL